MSSKDGDMISFEKDDDTLSALTLERYRENVVKSQFLPAIMETNQETVIMDYKSMLSDDESQDELDDNLSPQRKKNDSDRDTKSNEKITRNKTPEKASLTRKDRSQITSDDAGFSVTKNNEIRKNWWSWWTSLNGGSGLESRDASDEWASLAVSEIRQKKRRSRDPFYCCGLEIRVAGKFQVQKDI